MRKNEKKDKPEDFGAWEGMLSLRGRVYEVGIYNAIKPEELIREKATDGLYQHIRHCIDAKTLRSLTIEALKF